MPSFKLLSLLLCAYSSLAVLNNVPESLDFDDSEKAASEFNGFGHNTQKKFSSISTTSNSRNENSYPDGYRYNGPSHKYLPPPPPQTQTPVKPKDNGYNYQQPQIPNEASQKYLPPASTSAKSEQTNYRYQQSKTLNKPSQKYLPPLLNSDKPKDSNYQQQQLEVPNQNSQRYLPPPVRVQENKGYNYQQSQIPNEASQKYFPPSFTSVKSEERGYQYQAPQTTNRPHKYLPPASNSAKPQHNSYQYQQSEIPNETSQKYLPPASTQTSVKTENNGYNYQQPQIPNETSQQYTPPTFNSVKSEERGYQYQGPQPTTNRLSHKYLPPASNSPKPQNNDYQYVQSEIPNDTSQRYSPPASTQTSANTENNGYNYQRPLIQNKNLDKYSQPAQTSSTSEENGYQYQQPQFSNGPSNKYLPTASNSAKTETNGYTHQKPQTTASMAGSYHQKGPSNVQLANQHMPNYFMPTEQQQFQSNQERGQGYFIARRPTGFATIERVPAATNYAKPNKNTETLSGNNFQPNSQSEGLNNKYNVKDFYNQPLSVTSSNSDNQQNAEFFGNKATSERNYNRAPLLVNNNNDKPNAHNNNNYNNNNEQLAVPADTNPNENNNFSIFNYNSNRLPSQANNNQAFQQQNNYKQTNNLQQRNNNLKLNDAYGTPQQLQGSAGFNLITTTKPLTDSFTFKNTNNNKNIQQNAFSAYGVPTRTNAPHNFNTQANEIALQTPVTTNSPNDPHHFSTDDWSQPLSGMLQMIQMPSRSYELPSYFSMEQHNVPSTGLSFDSTSSANFGSTQPLVQEILQDSKMPPSQTLFNLEAPRQPHAVYGSPLGTPQSTLQQSSVQLRDFQPPHF